MTLETLTLAFQTLILWRAAHFSALAARAVFSRLAPETPYNIPGCESCRDRGRFQCKEHGRATLGEFALLNAASFAKLQKRVAKYTRKAVRCDNGQTPGILATAPLAVPFGWSEGNRWHMDAEEMYAVRLTGALPTMADGWELLGRIDHEAAGNVVVGAREKVMPEGSRDHNGSCDHCGKVRRRSQTYALRNVETNAVKFVGRNCLADFLRDSDVDSLMAGIDWVCEPLSDDELDNLGDYPRGGSRNYVETRYLLVCGARAVREDSGFIPARAENGRESTVSRALDSFPGGGKPYRKPGIFVTPAEHTPADYQRADLALEFAKMLPGVSDYENNLKVILAAPVVNIRKHAAFAVSIFAAMDRAERAAHEARKTAARKVVSEYQGTPGQRMKLPILTIRATPSWDTDYGTQFANIMEDDNGNVFVWKTSFAVGEKGERVTGVGTVKSHEERNGVRQTQLSRCKMEDAPAETSPAA